MNMTNKNLYDTHLHLDLFENQEKPWVRIEGMFDGEREVHNARVVQTSEKIILPPIWL